MNPIIKTAQNVGQDIDRAAQFVGGIGQGTMQTAGQAAGFVGGIGQGIAQTAGQVGNFFDNSKKAVQNFFGGNQSPMVSSVKTTTQAPTQATAKIPLQQPTPQQALIRPTNQPTTAPTTSPTITPTPQNTTTNMFPAFHTAPVPAQLAPLIYKSAMDAGIDPNVFASILFSEHGFQADQNMTPSYDEKGNFLGYDRGVAQINSYFHPEVTNEQAWDPNFAIPYAAKNIVRSYLDQVKAKGGNLAQGYAAYNVGVGGAMINGAGVLGPKGTKYLKAITQGLDPEYVKKIGLTAQEYIPPENPTPTQIPTQVPRLAVK